ncbi:MAG: hypothetical protein QW486_05355 [Candidatus Bathyarchaeia archaeon]
MLTSLARMAPSEEATPTPRLSAVDSMPRQMIRAMSPHLGSVLVACKKGLSGC